MTGREPELTMKTVFAAEPLASRLVHLGPLPPPRILDLKAAQPSPRKPNLTGLPAQVLAYLRANPERIVSRDELCTNVWHMQLHPLSRAIDQAVSVARKHLRADERVVAVYGYGYRLEQVSPENGRSKQRDTLCS
jgi:hypothetical protein